MLSGDRMYHIHDDAELRLHHDHRLQRTYSTIQMQESKDEDSVN